MEKWETVRKLRLIIFSAMESGGWRGKEFSHCENQGSECGILTHICRKLHISQKILPTEAQSLARASL